MFANGMILLSIYVAVFIYTHICSGLCTGDTWGTVCCQRGYPAIVLTKGGSGDRGGGDRAEDHDKNKDRACYPLALKSVCVKGTRLFGRHQSQRRLLSPQYADTKWS